MKKLKTLVIAFVGFSMLMACGNSPETKTAKAEIKEAAQSVNQLIEKETVGLKAEIKTAQAKIDERLRDLKIEWGKAEGEMKAEIEESMDELKYQQKQLERHLENVDQQTEAGWNSFKASVQQTLGGLEAELKEMKEELK